jgi:hypothetical protein
LFSKRTVRLFCTNQAWAEKLAAANRTSVRPRNLTRARGPIAVAWAGLLSLAMVALVWQQGTAYARSKAKIGDPAPPQAALPPAAAEPAPARMPSASAPTPAHASPAVKTSTKPAPKRK